jgi:hypothetical protein
MSQIPEDVCVIAGSFGPSIKDERTEYTVRGVPVSPVRVDPYVDEKGRHYWWCVFPDYRVMLVNAGNIRERKIGKYDVTAIAKAASGAD